VPVHPRRMGEPGGLEMAIKQAAGEPDIYIAAAHDHTDSFAGAVDSSFQKSGQRKDTGWLYHQLEALPEKVHCSHECLVRYGNHVMDQGTDDGKCMLSEVGRSGAIRNSIRIVNGLNLTDTERSTTVVPSIRLNTDHVTVG